MSQHKQSRVVVFVDGFNLYHFINRTRSYHGYKWLDIRSFSEKYLPPSANISRIIYFSALPYWNPKKVKRHELYIKALESIGVEIRLGKFKKVKKHIELNYRCSIVYTTYEEKQTDVSIGVEMLCSAHKDEFDIALLISGDTDFEPVIQIIKEEFPEKEIRLVVPNRKIVKPLDDLADKCTAIKEHQLATSQFPEEITLLTGRKISRPRKWTRQAVRAKT